MNLADKVVLVTGAARRVGRAIAVRLARAGCRIAVHFNTSAEQAEEVARLCRDAGVEAAIFQADLGHPRQTESLVPAVADRWGRLDVLINNASVFEEMPIERFTRVDWDHTLAINLTAPAVLAHAAHASLRKARGRIINICDASTSRPWPQHLAYAVSKGGLETLTCVLARALAPEVNVVGIAPGVVAWPERYDQAKRDRLTTKIPLRRAGSPEDVAAAVDYVLREGDYLTGVILPLDGGRRLA